MTNATKEAPPKAFAPTTAFDSTTRKKRRVESKMSFTHVRDRLLNEAKRTKDLLVPYKDLHAEATEVKPGEFALMIRAKGHGAYRMYEPVLDQVCNHCTIDDRRTLSGAYLGRMLEFGDNESVIELAAENINRWFAMRSGEHHKTRKGAPIKDGEKRVLLRLLADDKGEYIARAMLSDRYMVIPNSQLILTAFNIINGKDGRAGDFASHNSAARGAVMFDWAHSPFELKLGFVNPSFAFDMRNPEKGVTEAKVVDMPDGGHGFMYAGGTVAYQPGTNHKDPGHHWVMPAAFISNSETGGGSASVEMAILEGICENSAKLSAFTRRHVGTRQVTLDEYESDSTQKKYIELVGSQFADALRQVFDIKKFEENCRRFLGLFDQTVASVEEVTKWALQQVQALDLLNDALKAYVPFNPGRDSVGDVQRALTNIAQDQPEDKAQRLNSLAGDILSGDIKVKKELLLVS